MSTRPYHITCYGHHTTPYTMPCPLDYTMPCPPDHTIYMSSRQATPYTSPGNTVYHAIPASPYHISCHAFQAIPYTMPCPLDHTIYMLSRQATPYTIPFLDRQYHIPCYARQAIPYILPCPQGHTINHILPCPPGHTIYPAMPARQCHIGYPARPHHIPSHYSRGNTIYHAMPTRPYHVSCHALWAISYTMPCPSDQTIYHVMPARPYHIACHVGSWSGIERNGKGPKGLVTRCTSVMSIVKEDDSFLWKLLFVNHKRLVMHCGSVMASLPCFSRSLR